VQGYDAAQMLAAGLNAVKGDFGKRDAMIAAMRKAQIDSPRGKYTVIGRAHGFRGWKVNRGIESPERYLLQIFWDTLEDHTVGFRGGPLFARVARHRRAVLRVAAGGRALRADHARAAEPWAPGKPRSPQPRRIFDSGAFVRELARRVAIRTESQDPAAARRCRPTWPTRWCRRWRRWASAQHDPRQPGAGLAARFLIAGARGPDPARRC
jgi:heme-degrading monooxygenase HmoA